MNAIQATKRHYAMLQHRQSPDRIPLDYEVLRKDGSLIQAARLWVKADSKGQRKAICTRVTNLLFAMFSLHDDKHAHEVNCKLGPNIGAR